MSYTPHSTDIDDLMAEIGPELERAGVKVKQQHYKAGNPEWFSNPSGEGLTSSRYQLYATAPSGYKDADQRLFQIKVDEDGKVIDVNWGRPFEWEAKNWEHDLGKLTPAVAENTTIYMESESGVPVVIPWGIVKSTPYIAGAVLLLNEIDWNPDSSDKDKKKDPYPYSNGDPNDP